MYLAQFDRPQLLLLAGMVLLGWVLIRRSVARRRRSIREGRESDRMVRSLRQPKRLSVPLSDAPPETQRWQAALFDLQRELKAELDSRIAVVQTLIRHADARIEELRRMEEQAEGKGGSPTNHSPGDAIQGKATG